MLHDLKIKQCFFDPVMAGVKTFEIRRNADRGFQAGDEIRLSEVDGVGVRTGRQVNGLITYVINYEQKEDYVVFSFQLYGARP